MAGVTSGKEWRIFETAQNNRLMKEIGHRFMALKGIHICKSKHSQALRKVILTDYSSVTYFVVQLKAAH